MAHKRVTLSLTTETAASLDYIAHKLGASRSAIASDLLSEAVKDLIQIVRYLPAEGSSDTPLRARGASAELIRDRLDALRDASIPDPDNFELDPCSDRPAGCSCSYHTGERVPPRGGCLVHRDRGDRS